MRRVLMICYFYPPTRSVGSIRSVEFAKLLPNFGWRPTVVSVKKAQESWFYTGATVPPDVEVSYTPELPYPRFLDILHGCCSKLCGLFGVDLKQNYFRKYFAIPDSQLFWIHWIKGHELAKGADAIYVSCGPHSAAIGATIISKLTGKPLVIDFRDSWSYNPYDKREGLTFFITNSLEKWVLRQSAKILLNTDGALRLYQKHLPEFNEKYVCIPNGYDSVPNYNFTNSDQFTILHLGTFYMNRKPDLVLRAMRELPELNMRFIQVGGPFESYPQFADMPNLTVVDSIKREETIRYMEQASLLYLKQGWEEGVSDYIMVAAKTYEYITSGIPILIDAPPGDNIEMVKRYATKKYLVEDPNDFETMKAHLRAAHADWKTQKANAAAQPTGQRSGINPEFLEKFDRKNLAGQLARVLDAIVPGHN